LAIDEVAIMRGENGVAVEIRVLMNNAAGIFQVEETLTKKVIASPIRNYVTVVATTEPSGEHDQRIIQRVRLHSREPRFVLEK
jgi:metal-dependent HD superfamily phosphatase/phosphodiesterase